MFRNRRAQKAVGQGFFHGAELKDGRTVLARYVYDCGAMAHYRNECDREIDGYVAKVGVGRKLDFLFISHAHADHINGVGRLLHRSKGLKIGTIILPLLEDIDRLIAFARTLVEDPGSAATDFYRQFIVDPTAALSGFGPDQILYVESGSREDGAPGRDGPPEGAPDGPRIFGGGSDGKPAWKLMGKGQVRSLNGTTKASGSGQAGPFVAVIPDTSAPTIIGRTVSSHLSWLLAPYIDPTVSNSRVAFLDQLAAEFGWTRAVLDKWLATPGSVEQLVIDHRPKLSAAYATIDKNLNVTTMCLYSGPHASNATRIRGELNFHTRRWSFRGKRDRLAWLASGDAVFGKKKPRANFLAHYGVLLKQVATFTLPHHGSDHNFHGDLLDAIRPDFCIASADRYSKWRHPGSYVIQEVASRGFLLFAVTSRERSSVCEEVKIS